MSAIDSAHDHEHDGSDQEPNGNDKHVASIGAMQHCAMQNSTFPWIVNMFSSLVLRRKN